MTIKTEDNIELKTITEKVSKIIQHKKSRKGGYD